MSNYWRAFTFSGRPWPFLRPVPRNLCVERYSTVATGQTKDRSSSNSCSLILGPSDLCQTVRFFIVKELFLRKARWRSRRPKDQSSAPVRRDRMMGKSRETVPQSRRRTRRAIERANAFTTCSLILPRVASVSRHDKDCIS
jgi:hypothetical protein